nr:anti-sigma factor [Methylotenera sp.]
PGWMLALAKNKAGKPEMRVTALASLKPQASKSFELWILPPDKSAPISLGVLPQQGNQQVVVSEKTATLLADGGLAVTLEPVGGSPTGGPTGAVVYQGKLAEI